MKGEKLDLYQHVTDQIIAAIEAGTRPWRRGWAATGGLQLRTTGDAYQGVNQFLLAIRAAAEGFTSPFWLTFNQAKQDGLNIKKGARSEIVVFTKRIAVEDPEQPEGKKVIPILKSYRVFNLDQCEPQEGRSIPARYVRAPSAAPAEPRPADVEAAILKGRVDLRFGGDAAFYRPDADFVQMPVYDAFVSAGAYVATLAHEVVHWSGHPSRLARKFGRFGDPAYAREELVAELGAAMVCARLGVEGEHIDNHAAYVASWLKVLRSDKRAIFNAASLAQAAADFILGSAAEEIEDEPERLAA